MAGFQLSINGRFWVSTEERSENKGFGGGGSRPCLASPQGEANLAGYAADIDRAIARDMEAAGVGLLTIIEFSNDFHKSKSPIGEKRQNAGYRLEKQVQRMRLRPEDCGGRDRVLRPRIDYAHSRFLQPMTGSMITAPWHLETPSPPHQNGCMLGDSRQPRTDRLR